MNGEDLHKPQKSHETLLDTVSDYVIAIDRDYRIVMANDGFRKKVGMSGDALCFEAWMKRDRRCEDCLVEKCFQDGQVRTEEKYVPLKDGRTALMRIMAAPLMDPQGKIVYVLETATDMTEEDLLQRGLKRFAGGVKTLSGDRLRSLEESEDRYRTIFDSSRDAIVLTNAEGRILEINRAGLEVFGYTRRGELVNRVTTMDLFVSPEDFTRFQDGLSAHGFVREFETSLFKRRGKGFDALITSSMIQDPEGGIEGYVIIIRDITHRKAAEGRIREQNARLAALNAISTTVSRSLDLTEVLNTAADRIQELIGSDCVRIYLLHAEDQRLSLAVHRGLSPSFLEKPHVSTRRVGDGWIGQTVQKGKVRVVDNLLRSEDPYANHLLEHGFKSTVYIPLVSRGEPIGVLVVSRREPFNLPKDFIEFLTALGNHIGVAVQNAHLYEDAKIALQDLKNAHEQVIQSEKLASLGKLSASIAHEINNPLAAVLTYIRLLAKLMDRGQLMPERMGEVQKYLGIMGSETARCGEIVKNLLAFSRQSSVRMGSHSIEDILDKAILLVAHDLDLKGIRLEREIEPNVPAIHCDPMQIEQAILNLLSNASESMAGGGVISIKAGRSQDGGTLEIGIRDTGCGIPEDYLKNIFEPFFTTKGEGKGVGLGLSITYGIVTRHNGSIDVTSEPGIGSRFTIRLPVA